MPDFTGLSSKNFQKEAFRLYEIQGNNNQVFKDYCNHTQRKSLISDLEDIPFLPISFFKTHRVFEGTAEKVFYSSGTTSDDLSQHGIKRLEVYEESFMGAFKQFYGDPSDYIILALLPGYLEREGSSLVYMVSKLIDASNSDLSGFFLNDFDSLQERLKQSLDKKERTPILIGVSFALLDFAEQCPMPLDRTVVMETGGMKGRRKELTRLELHERLQGAFQVDCIHSEYGMTELLSQAYSKGEGVFTPPSWMKVLVRDPLDPFDVSAAGKGLLNIIDLANEHSCAFIATDDLGEVLEDGSFMVLGRSDFSQVRGCNLLYTS